MHSGLWLSIEYEFKQHIFCLTIKKILLLGHEFQWFKYPMELDRVFFKQMWEVCSSQLLKCMKGSVLLDHKSNTPWQITKYEHILII